MSHKIKNTRADYDKMIAAIKNQPWYKVLKHLEDPAKTLDVETALEKFGIKNLAKVILEIMDEANFLWTIRKEIRTIMDDEAGLKNITYYRRDIDHPQASWQDFDGDKEYHDHQYKMWKIQMDTDIYL